MGKSSITALTGEGDVFGKLKAQMDRAQEMTGRTEKLLAEARGLLHAYIRQKRNLQYSNYCDMVLEVSKCSEKLTEMLRRLALEVTLDEEKYEDYKSDLVLIHGIEIVSTAGVLKVSLPVLVPHRKESYTDYLYKPLYTACRHWCMKQAETGGTIPEFEKSTVCFEHRYDKTLPLARVRDHDNLEEKHVLDVLAGFFMQSDNGLYVDTYHVTRLAEKDRTWIYVMDSCCFPAWLSRFHQPEGIEKSP